MVEQHCILACDRVLVFCKLVAIDSEPLVLFGEALAIARKGGLFLGMPGGGIAEF